MDVLLLDLLLDMRACRFSFCLWANSLAYSAAASLFFSDRCLLRASTFLLRWILTGVTRRWILGALELGLRPSFSGRGRWTTYCRTSSSFERLKSFLILPTLLGPRRRGAVVSVNPGISCSPFLTTTKSSTLKKFG